MAKQGWELLNNNGCTPKTTGKNVDLPYFHASKYLVKRKNLNFHQVMSTLFLSYSLSAARTPEEPELAILTHSPGAILPGLLSQVD